jgi:hypothetical protein
MMVPIQTTSSLLDYIKSNLLNNGQNLSIRGLARLCDIQHTSIIRDGAFNSEKLGQILTAEGFEAGALEENGFNAKATWLVIEYFAYESKAKAPGAKQIARTFGQIGVMTTFDQLTRVAEPVAQALPPRPSVVEYINALEKIGSLGNPILKAALEQRAAEELATTLLPSSDEHDLVLVAVLARELGYSLKPGQDSQLGKFVKRHHEPRGQAQHGRYPVNVYLKNEILETVHAFFR